jgi:hypothetical protein
VEAPSILNSKVKKIRIELPFFNFSHSSSGDSAQPFIGRERIREKIVKVVEDNPEEPGVYLVAGNRGVGKTSLVSEVIKETSLTDNTAFIKNIRYLLFLVLITGIIQGCFYLLHNLGIEGSVNSLIVISVCFFIILSVASFIGLGLYSGYRFKNLNEKKKVILDSIISAIKEFSYLVNPFDPNRSIQNVFKSIIIVCAILISDLLLIKIDNKQKYICVLLIVFFLYLIIVIPVNFYRYCKSKLRVYKKRKMTWFKIIYNPIKKYIKSHNRLYLRINFGHKLSDEKDILRLIARTLETEYKRFHHRWRRKLPYRIMKIGLLFLLLNLFYSFGVQKMFVNLEENSDLNMSNSKTSLNGNISIIEDVFGPSKQYEFNNFLLETTKEAKKSPYWLQEAINNFGTIINSVLNPFDIFGKLFSLDNIIIGTLIIPEIIIFYLVFLLLYIIIILLLRCNWIMNFFCTHQLIMRKLKNLNNDITYSTERKYSISLVGDNKAVKRGIGASAKKSRNIADAREIEKELQEIINDIQRIPVIMCRPKIVIVFDELDKVESGDTDSEKENQQTKASLFSINAMRERQTEILRILSNMKYFLSTARAKFIFIAGREMYDIYLADVSERNNYIGSIFNTIVYVPSFLNDHCTGTNSILQESSIASLTEEFVCSKLIPYEYNVDSYSLKNYYEYLKAEKLCKGIKGIDDNRQSEIEEDKMQKSEEEKIQKIIAVLQQFIIYLAHISKGAPKKMMQLFESFVEINIKEREKTGNTQLVQKYRSSRHFLSFNYYRQYTIGIVAYLITPIFYRLSETNIKEHSDKLLVSALRFVDFLFKFHKDSFSWKHLNMSPEMLEVNHPPELKSVAVDLVNYLSQIHINNSTFSLSEYKFDGLIANEIFSMAKTEEVFSALFSFSLDETLPLREYYQDLLKETKKDYEKERKSATYIDTISPLEVMLGDLHYYADELEQAETYYKSSVQALRTYRTGENKNSGLEERMIVTEKSYLYVRNMLRLGIIYEKRKQNDFAYQIYNEISNSIILEHKRNLNYLLKGKSKNNINKSVIDNMLYHKVAYEGLKILYLPFIAKLQILEKSHVGGISYKDLELLDKEFYSLTENLNNQGEARIIEAEYYSRLADILYYKNSDLKGKFGLSRKNDIEGKNKNDDEFPRDCSCTACYYYHKALSILLNIDLHKKDENTIIKLLFKSMDIIHNNYNVKICTTLARILSDWGNVFYSCDKINCNDTCYIYDGEKCNTKLNVSIKDGYTYEDICKENVSINLRNVLKKYRNMDNKSKAKYRNNFNIIFFPKLEIAFAMYSISSNAYCKANLYKRYTYQIYKMICVIKDYKIYDGKISNKCVVLLSKKAIQYLWYAYEDIIINKLNKRKVDFDKKNIEEKIPLKYLLVDSEITRIKVLVSEINLKTHRDAKDLRKHYEDRITSPYEINYSIIARICRLRLKSKINYETYKLLLKNAEIIIDGKIKYVLIKEDYNKLINKENEENLIKIIKNIFDGLFNFDDDKDIILRVLESLIAESIYCLLDIAQLNKTMDESYLFPHSFLGSVHEQLSFWIRQYEEYEKYKEDRSQIEKYLRQYLDEEWRQQLSGYRENKLAILHYNKCLEMHKSGKAYYNMIDTMCYVKDDFNDRIDHFNIAEERHLIINGEIERRIKELEKIYRNSSLYKIDNYHKSGNFRDE